MWMISFWPVLLLMLSLILKMLFTLNSPSRIWAFYFLGLKVTRSSIVTVLSQSKFILDILKDVGMMDCKSSSFSLPRGLHLSPETGDLLPKPLVYRSGRLLYVNLTRPYISYVMQYLSRFMTVSRKSYLEVAFYVLRYLKGALH